LTDESHTMLSVLLGVGFALVIGTAVSQLPAMMADPLMLLGLILIFSGFVAYRLVDVKKLLQYQAATYIAALSLAGILTAFLSTVMIKLTEVPLIFYIYYNWGLTTTSFEHLFLFFLISAMTMLVGLTYFFAWVIMPSKTISRATNNTPFSYSRPRPGPGIACLDRIP
jgi:hypothetical protein